MRSKESVDLGILDVSFFDSEGRRGRKEDSAPEKDFDSFAAGLDKFPRVKRFEEFFPSR